LEAQVEFAILRKPSQASQQYREHSTRDLELVVQVIYQLSGSARNSRTSSVAIGNGIRIDAQRTAKDSRVCVQRTHARKNLKVMAAHCRQPQKISNAISIGMARSSGSIRSMVVPLEMRLLLKATQASE
jgi:hypothetical protein